MGRRGEEGRRGGEERREEEEDEKAIKMRECTRTKQSDRLTSLQMGTMLKILYMSG